MCRTERETLETGLFELQQQINQIESRRQQLESENQNLRLRADSMMGKSERKTSIGQRNRHVAFSLVVTLSLSVSLAELKRLRAERETLLSQSEKEEAALRDALAAAQHEAQRSLRTAQSDHQEELERLTHQKVITHGSLSNTVQLL